MRIRVCLAGATGWAGSALAKGISTSSDIVLDSAVSRSCAGKTLQQALGLPGNAVPIFGSVSAALARGPEVFFEYTAPQVARNNIIEALNAGAHVVVGTSGLSEQDFEAIAALAEEKKLGVLAVGNFALGAALLQKFAETAAKHLAHWEIIDYARSHKVDAPSGTARELASRLAKIREPQSDVPLEKVLGARESRGAKISGSQIHSVRLPGYVISIEALFGATDERLSIRHDCGTSADIYVPGALLAIRTVHTVRGLRRGLDSVLGF